MLTRRGKVTAKPPLGGCCYLRFHPDGWDDFYLGDHPVHPFIRQGRAKARVSNYTIAGTEYARRNDYFYENQPQSGLESRGWLGFSVQIAESKLFSVNMLGLSVICVGSV